MLARGTRASNACWLILIQHADVGVIGHLHMLARGTCANDMIIAIWLLSVIYDSTPIIAEVMRFLVAV
eukprot:scaffold100456_cov56-Cyclotella_meneghiniana.AAC.1